MMILPILATFLNDKCQQPIAPRGLSTVFINKILFKHSHSHSFMYRLWLLSLRSSSVDSAAGTRDHGAEKYFQSDSLQKRFADPWGGSSQLCLHHSCPQYFRIQVQWGQPTPVFLPGKSQGQRSPVGYSQWGRRESDTTRQLNDNWCCCLGHISPQVTVI